MKRTLCIILCLFLTIGWIGFIFSNSLDNGAESTEKSSTVSALINGVLHGLGISKTIPESTIRTLAHFTEFFVLGLFFCLDLALILPLSPKIPFSKKHLLGMLSLLPCTLVALADEWIQSFSPGRASQWEDVVMDLSGSLCALLFCSLAFVWVHRFWLRRQKKLT